MPEIKNEKELLIDLRNTIAFRLVEWRANLLYWQSILKKSKNNSPEAFDSQKNVDLNKTNLSKDQHFLKIIDGMIKDQK